MLHDVRDAVMDFVNRWKERTHLKETFFIEKFGIGRSKFFNWRNRYGKVNCHNSWIPRDFWIEDWEKKRIVEYYLAHPLEGYLCSVLDGNSRYIVHHEIREMREMDVEIILQRAKEKFPEARPRIISDNGPQLLLEISRNLFGSRE